MAGPLRKAWKIFAYSHSFAKKVLFQKKKNAVTYLYLGNINVITLKLVSFDFNNDI